MEPTFTWTASSPGAEWYDLYLMRNGTTYLDQWVQGTTNWTVTSGLPGGAYTWWVRGVNTNGVGEWSEPVDFDVQK